MDSSDQRDLSKAEWKVMRIVWELQKAMAREVYTIAGERHSWAPATVKTILRRLTEKGHVSATPVGNGFVYRPVNSASATLKYAAEALLTHAVEGTTGPVLAYLVERTALSADDLDSLQKLIDAKKQSFRIEIDHPTSISAEMQKLIDAKKQSLQQQRSGKPNQKTSERGKRS